MPNNKIITVDNISKSKQNIVVKLFNIRRRNEKLIKNAIKKIIRNAMVENNTTLSLISEEVLYYKIIDNLKSYKDNNLYDKLLNIENEKELKQILKSV